MKLDFSRAQLPDSKTPPPNDRRWLDGLPNVPTAIAHFLNHATEYYARPCVRVAERQYRVGNDPPITLTRRQDKVLAALIERRGNATIEQLRATGVDDANKILNAIIMQYPALKLYITLPGGKSRGGYRTTIKNGIAK